MRRNLIRYLPDILKRNLDFRILMEVQEKYGLQPIWEAAQEVFDDQFITTADEYGITRFEGILGLKPGKDDTLEDRRKAVLMAWRRKPHIGLPELQEAADIWGPGWTELIYDHPLTILVMMTGNAPFGVFEIGSLKRELRELAPANVDFEYAWRHLRIKEIHRQMSVEEMDRAPLLWFASVPDRPRSTGVLDFGRILIIRRRSRVSVRDDGRTLHISDSPIYRYEAPPYHQIGDGLWGFPTALTVAADNKLSVQDDGGTLYFCDKED